MITGRHHRTIALSAVACLFIFAATPAAFAGPPNTARAQGFSLTEDLSGPTPTLRIKWRRPGSPNSAYFYSLAFWRIGESKSLMQYDTSDNQLSATGYTAMLESGVTYRIQWLATEPRTGKILIVTAYFTPQY